MQFFGGIELGGVWDNKKRLVIEDTIILIKLNGI